MTGSKKEHMRIPNIGKIFTHGILSGILAFSASCSSRNDDPPTDAEGKRVVRTLEEYGADGRWGDRYHFFYTEDWELTRIENVQWYVMHDTLRQSRRIEIGEGSILVYEEDSPEITDDEYDKLVKNTTQKNKKVIKITCLQGKLSEVRLIHAEGVCKGVSRLRQFPGSHTPLF